MPTENSNLEITRSEIRGEFLTRKELATRWKISVKCLENWAITKNGKITRGPEFIRLSDRSVRYPIEAVIAFEQANSSKVK
jgi:hypothetical protein